MFKYTTRDGAAFIATGHEQFLSLLRKDSRDPRETDLDFRIATARAASLQTGYGIRSNTPGQLVEDLHTAGLVDIEDLRPWPSVGQGATIQRYSDRIACTIVAISATGKTIRIQPDRAELDNWSPQMVPGGFVAHCVNNDTQRYRYQPDPTAPVISACVDRLGRYKTAIGERVIEGRHHFRDYNF